MRVAYLTGDFAPRICGVCHYTETLAAHVARAGIEPLILTTRTYAENSSSHFVRGVTDGWGFDGVIELARFVTNGEIQRVHFQFTAPQSNRFRKRSAMLLLPVLLALLGWRGQFLTTVHEYYRGVYGEWRLPVFSRSFWGHIHSLLKHIMPWDKSSGSVLLSSSSIVVSNLVHQAQLVEDLPEIRDRLHLIRVGSNVSILQSFQPCRPTTLLRQSKWPDHAVLFGCFGFLNARKNLDLLLDAFARARYSCPQIRLLLIGGFHSWWSSQQSENPLRQRLCAKAAALGISRDVVITGYVEPSVLSSYLSLLNYGVLPFTDGTTFKSGALVTMLQAGIPVIVTAHRPTDVDLERCPMVVTVPNNDVNSLATAMERCSNGVHERTEVVAASKGIMEEFSWKTIARKHIELYQNQDEPEPQSMRTVIA
ncbi:MAG: glycosyltransferase family 4 protein [Nitrososphaera sp.]